MAIAAVHTPPALALPKTDLRQIEHDRLVAEQTTEQYRHMIVSVRE